MAQYVTCPSCACPARASESQCPFCGNPLRSNGTPLARAAAALLLGLTTGVAACDKDRVSADGDYGDGSVVAAEYGVAGVSRSEPSANASATTATSPAPSGASAASASKPSASAGGSAAPRK